MLYVLFGFAGLLVVIFVIIFFQYCRLYRTNKQEEVDGLVSNSVSPEEYEVESMLLCCAYALFTAACVTVRLN